jgi:hypothetical protein
LSRQRKMFPASPRTCCLYQRYGKSEWRCCSYHGQE